MSTRRIKLKIIDASASFCQIHCALSDDFDNLIERQSSTFVWFNPIVLPTNSESRRRYEVAQEH